MHQKLVISVGIAVLKFKLCAFIGRSACSPFQAVSKPTLGANALDIFLTTASETIGLMEYVDGSSDHYLLQVTLNTMPPITGITTKVIVTHK